MTDIVTIHLADYWRMYQDLVKIDVAQQNRLKARERDNIAEQYNVPLRVSLGHIQDAKKALDNALLGLLKQHFMFDWVQDIKGFGTVGFAGILGVLGDLDQFPNPAKAWKYMGMHVVDGRAPKRTKGELLGYSPMGRTVCHLIAEGLVRQNKGKYREIYDKRRATVLERERTEPSGCPFGHEHLDKKKKVLDCIKTDDLGDHSAHVDNDAKRVTVKELLKDMLLEWHIRSQELSEGTKIA